MSAALTINESKLLAKLIDSFKDKDKLNDEHTLIKALSKKSSLSDSDVKKLKLLLAAEKSKILAKENKRKAKAAVKLDQQERQSYIENRQKRFGMVFIEELKKLSEQHLDISLLAFISLLKENEAFQESEKKWLSNFVSDETQNSLINQVEINANSQKIF